MLLKKFSELPPHPNPIIHTMDRLQLTGESDCTDNGFRRVFPLTVKGEPMAAVTFYDADFLLVVVTSCARLGHQRRLLLDAEGAFGPRWTVYMEDGDYALPYATKYRQAVADVQHMRHQIGDKPTTNSTCVSSHT